MVLHTVHLPLANSTQSVTAYGFRIRDMRKDVARAVGPHFSAPARFLSQTSLPPLLKDTWITNTSEVIDLVVTCVGGSRTCIGLRLHPDSPQPAILAFPLPSKGTWYDGMKSKTSDGVCNLVTRCWVPTNNRNNYCFLTKAEYGNLTMPYQPDEWTEALSVAWQMLNIWNNHTKRGFTLDRFDMARLRSAIHADGRTAAEDLYNSFYSQRRTDSKAPERNHFDRLLINEANWLPLLGRWAVEDLVFVRADQLPNGMDWRQRIVMTTSPDRILVHQCHDKACSVYKLNRNDSESLPGKLTGSLESQALDMAIAARVLRQSDPVAATNAQHAMDAIRRVTGFGVHYRNYSVNNKPRGGHRAGHRKRSASDISPSQRPQPTRPRAAILQSIPVNLSPPSSPALPPPPASPKTPAVPAPQPMDIPQPLELPQQMDIPQRAQPTADAANGLDLDDDFNIDEFLASLDSHDIFTL